MPRRAPITVYDNEKIKGVKYLGQQKIKIRCRNHITLRVRIPSLESDAGEVIRDV